MMTGWQPIGAIDAEQITQLIVSRDQTLFAATSCGLLRRLPGGDDWEAIGQTLPGSRSEYVIWFDRDDLLCSTPGGRFRSIDAGLCWEFDDPGSVESTRAAPPLTDRETMVDLASYRGCGCDPATVAIASLNDVGQSSIWLSIEESPWRRVIHHPVPADVASLLLLDARRGLYVAIGDSVYRPARMGRMLAMREIVAPEGIVQLCGYQPDGRPAQLAGLTEQRMLVSSDGGFTWIGVEHPPGPPVTLIALMATNGNTQLITVRPGGELLAKALFDRTE